MRRQPPDRWLIAWLTGGGARLPGGRPSDGAEIAAERHSLAGSRGPEVRVRICASDCGGRSSHAGALESVASRACLPGTWLMLVWHGGDYGRGEFGSRGADAGRLFRGPGRDGVLRATGVGRFRSSRRIRRPAHSLWLDHREEVRWLNLMQPDSQAPVPLRPATARRSTARRNLTGSFTSGCGSVS